jgi:hypothetical protein
MAVILQTLPTVSTASSDVPLVVNNQHILVSSILIQADQDNTDSIYVGDVNVTSLTGVELMPGDSATIEVDLERNSELYLDEVYIISPSTLQKARLSVFRRRAG